MKYKKSIISFKKICMFTRMTFQHNDIFKKKNKIIKKKTC